MQEYIEPSNEILEPKYIRSTAKSTGIPDDAVEEGGFWWWVDLVGPDFQVWCTGGSSAPFRVVDHNAEYPYEIYRRRKDALAIYQSGQ